MLLLTIGVLLSIVSVALGWWLWRLGGRSALWIVGLTIATVLLVAGLAATGLYIWARNSTDSSQFARALVWGESAFGDQHRFPSRPNKAGDDVLVLGTVSAAPLAEYRSSNGEDLEQLLADNQTTAFIVLRGDGVLYEEYFNGSNHDDLQTSFSVAKSFTATLIGIAVDESTFTSLDDAVTDSLLELAERDQRYTEAELSERQRQVRPEPARAGEHRAYQKEGRQPDLGDRAHQPDPCRRARLITCLPANAP
jgi:hypothetical protein